MEKPTLSLWWVLAVTAAFVAAVMVWPADPRPGTEPPGPPPWLWDDQELIEQELVEDDPPPEADPGGPSPHPAGSPDP